MKSSIFCLFAAVLFSDARFATSYYLSSSGADDAAGTSPEAAWKCKDCVIEHNYSHDNQGPAFMAFGNHGTGTGTIICGNVSYNDATAEQRPGFAAISMISALSDTLVEGNTIIAGPDTQRLVGHHDWEGMPREVNYRDNLLIGNGKATVEASALVGGRFEGNIIIDSPDLPDGVNDSTKDSSAAKEVGMRRRAAIMKTAGRTKSNPKAGTGE